MIAEEEHRHPDDDAVLELLPAVGDKRGQEMLPAHLRTIGGRLDSGQCPGLL